MFKSQATQLVFIVLAISFVIIGSYQAYGGKYYHNKDDFKKRKCPGV